MTCKCFLLVCSLSFRPKDLNKVFHSTKQVEVLNPHIEKPDLYLRAPEMVLHWSLLMKADHGSNSRSGVLIQIYNSSPTTGLTLFSGYMSVFFRTSQKDELRKTSLLLREQLKVKSSVIQKVNL